MDRLAIFQQWTIFNKTLENPEIYTIGVEAK